MLFSEPSLCEKQLLNPSPLMVRTQHLQTLYFAHSCSCPPEVRSRPMKTALTIYTYESRPQLRPAPPHSEIEKASVLTLATVRVCIHACDPPGLWRLPVAQKHPENFARYSVRVYHAINYARSPREHECGSIKHAKPRAPHRPSSRRLHCCQAALKILYSQTHKRNVDRRSAARCSPHSHTHAPPKATPAYYHTLQLTSNGLRLGKGFMANSSENTILER